MAFVHNELSTPSRIRIYVATVYTTYCFYYLPLLPESSSTNEVSLLRGVGRMKCSGIIFEGECLIYAPTFFRKIFCNLRKTSFRREGLNVSTTPLRQWGFWQRLPFSWTTLKGKHCRHSIAVMGVVDTFEPWQSSWGLWVENRAEFFCFFQIFQNCPIFQPFLNFWKSGVYSNQSYCLQITSSPILKFGLCWGHLVWGWFPLW